VITSPIRAATPRGYLGAGTFFVNIKLTPEPPAPLPPPGLVLVLPLLNPMPSGTRLDLFQVDAASGQLVPSLDPLGQSIVGKVDSGGVTATFAGVTRVSTFVGLVRDTQPPILILPSTITAEATGAAGAVVSFTAAAVDPVDGPVPVTCTPASGSIFSIATTTVGCSASDQAGNTAVGSFDVVVQDTTPPVLMLPPDFSVPATSADGAFVEWGVRAKDTVDGDTNVSCVPTSGRTYPIGATKVICTSSDRHGNKATGSFTVTVTPLATPGHMKGAGQIAVDALVHHFQFDVREQNNGAERGSLEYELRRRKTPGDPLDTARTVNRFRATGVTSVAFFDVAGSSPGKRPVSGIDQVAFAGVGRWNGRAGYTFEVVALDAGEPGKGRDRFTLTIRDGAGNIVGRVDGLLTRGNIQSLRAPKTVGSAAPAPN
jgi:hypothetical protein